MKKDPYLSELDAMDDLEPPTQVEEPTHIDVKVASKAPIPTEVQEEIQEEIVPVEGAEPVQEILDLSPDLSVPLVIVMGRKNYTVKDLLALRMGQVMELDRAPLEPVDLVAAGRVIGKGELVEVEGKLGVRILKLLK